MKKKKATITFEPNRNDDEEEKKCRNKKNKIKNKAENREMKNRPTDR